jgi:hypothetical protein
LSSNPRTTKKEISSFYIIRYRMGKTDLSRASLPMTFELFCGRPALMGPVVTICLHVILLKSKEYIYSFCISNAKYKAWHKGSKGKWPFFLTQISQCPCEAGRE